MSERLDELKYGRPPIVDCCSGGAMLDSAPVRILEFWTRIDEAGLEWRRRPELERALGDPPPRTVKADECPGGTCCKCGTSTAADESYLLPGEGRGFRFSCLACHPLGEDFARHVPGLNDIEAARRRRAEHLRQRESDTAAQDTDK